MGVVLTAVALVICVTTLLSPEHLTLIANRMANRLLDAEVTIGRVELGFKRNSPLVTLKVDDLTILSKPMLEAADRTGFPSWADSLLTLDSFEGGINIVSLVKGEIELHDVVFDGPAINLFAANDSLVNYSIYTSSPSEKDEKTALPKISINRFQVLNPHPVRFSNISTGKNFTLSLDALSIDGGNAPTYSFKIGGDFDYPELSVYNLDQMSFGMDGKVAWDPERPTEVEITNFRFESGCISALISATADFGEDIVVKDYNFFMYDTPVESALEMLPDSLRREYGLTKNKFSTDIAVSVGVRSTGPFNLTTDSIPNAEIEIEVIPGRLRYERILLDKVGGKLFAYLRGNDLGLATFVAEDFNVAGPSTDLLFNFQASSLLDDPLVTGTVKGHTELSKLPSKVNELINGYIRGKLTADISFTGRQSMLDRNNFHKLHVNGDIDAYNVYYLSADTNNMLNASHACLMFGTHTQVKRDSAAKADSMLTAVISLDSATFLHTEYSMNISDFKLAVGVMNQRESVDTTLVLPMGGDLRLGKFYLLVLGDSIAFNVRNAHGHITMRRFKGMSKVPEFLANLEMDFLSTGSPDTRFMLSGTKLDCSAFKLPPRGARRNIKNTADSIRKAYPDIPLDSVYRRAIEIQREKHKHHGPPRIHPEYTAEETEILDWGTSNFLRKLLLDWKLKGKLSARRAGLFTPYFPVRNRMRNFNVEFNNDSINLTNVQFKAGSSDFLLSGVISNVRRGLTSQGFRSPVRLNFDMLSDTIDINEIADATFRGSAYAYSVESGAKSKEHIKFNIDSIEAAETAGDDAFEKEMGKIVVDSPDEMAPFMVPVNIDLNLKARSKNIYYSDLWLKDFEGEVLVSQGGLNLNDLTAKSDIGSVSLSALYSSPSADDIKFGFGLNVNDFNINRFTRLVPAVDSIMPLLRDIRGIIDAQVAATCDIDSAMNIELPSLEAAIKISGDSLELIDKETYRNIGKWLLFKDKQDNVIKHMDVEVVVKDEIMTLYPFIFDLDRYKLGIQGYNDLALNFDYHIAVLKSPLPFKFGVNIEGNPDHYKIRLGKANMNEKTVQRSISIVDTTRINLLAQIQNVFRRGVNNSRFAKIEIADHPSAASINLNEDTITHADSLLFIQEGLIPAPIVPAQPAGNVKKGKNRKSKGAEMMLPMLAVIVSRPKRKKSKWAKK